MKDSLFPYSLIILFLSVSLALQAQTDTGKTMSLDSVNIKAYYGKDLLQTGAAVNYISSKQLGRFNNTSVLQALNATPGVKMEERSPGSYRLNIRGSSVRSPFGVRNVKIYYDDIPFTAPGGASMFNMIGYYNVGSLEVIKGPGGSVYGAGTGGVLLIHPPESNQQKATATLMGGSYGLFGAHASVVLRNNILQYEHLQSNGYRNHTAMRRDNFSWDANLRSSEKNTLKLHLLYSNLFYETPGALTLTEFNVNPRAARPATPAFPGAEQARASIHQQNILAGLRNTFTISSRLKNTSSLYGFYSYIKNPTVQNYERKREPHFGGRTIFTYHFKKDRSLFELNAGGEFQQGIFRYKTFKNVAGKPDSLRIEDELDIDQYFVFAQLNWNYKNWILTAGASMNTMQLDFARLSAQPVINEEKNFTAQVTPRFSVLYKTDKNISVYFNIAKGFSPPAADEIFADNNSYNLALAPEKGWNYEPGIRGSLLNKRLDFDISYFITGLENSIVTRRDSGGGNYYINAGKTSQHGLEGSVAYEFFADPDVYLSGSSIRATYSHYRFRYKDFIQGTNDYSGNTMPGVSPHNINLLLDIQTKAGYYVNLSYSYTDKIELNDANSASAKAYHLLSAKTGCKKQVKKITWSFFAGADNITDERYSLGNDINGFGGRYYNVAAGRSFYAGIGLGM
jgi:iron complex outermembrane receptor protein